MAKTVEKFGPKNGQKWTNKSRKFVVTLCKRCDVQEASSPWQSQPKIIDFNGGHSRP